ncbi:MAG: hypothetical protein IJP30_01015 [Clostridia bacterium]|nr:hypothetical protein [Clostridia bacterium]
MKEFFVLIAADTRPNDGAALAALVQKLAPRAETKGVRLSCRCVSLSDVYKQQGDLLVVLAQGLCADAPKNAYVWPGTPLSGAAADLVMLLGVACPPLGADLAAGRITFGGDPVIPIERLSSVSANSAVHTWLGDITALEKKCSDEQTGNETGEALFALESLYQQKYQCQQRLEALQAELFSLHRSFLSAFLAGWTHPAQETAFAFFLSGEIAKAADALSPALSVPTDENHVRILMQAAALLHLCNQDEQADLCYRMAADAARDRALDPAPFAAYADFLSASPEPAAAVPYYEAFVALSAPGPAMINALHKLGRLRFAVLGDRIAARQAYLRAAKTASEHRAALGANVFNRVTFELALDMVECLSDSLETDVLQQWGTTLMKFALPVAKMDGERFDASAFIGACSMLAAALLSHPAGEKPFEALRALFVPVWAQCRIAFAAQSALPEAYILFLQPYAQARAALAAPEEQADTDSLAGQVIALSNNAQCLVINDAVVDGRRFCLALPLAEEAQQYALLYEYIEQDNKPFFSPLLTLDVARLQQAGAEAFGLLTQVLPFDTARRLLDEWVRSFSA